MSQRQTPKCPKCRAEMRTARVPNTFRILKEGDLQGDEVQASYCTYCGFVELYKVASTREPWRWPKYEQAPASEEPRAQKEEPSRGPAKRIIR